MAIAALLLAAVLTQDPADEYEFDYEESPWSTTLTYRASYSSGDISDTSIRYRDIFGTGHGFSIQVNHAFEQHPNSEFSGYLELGWDTFRGLHFRDDFNDLIAAEDSEQLSFLAGGRVTHWFGAMDPEMPIVLEGRFALGMATLSEVNADFEVSGVPVPNQQLLRSSVVPIMDMGVRWGVASSTFTFTLGMGVRVVGGQSRGRDVTSAVDPDVRTDFTLDLGWELRF